MFYIVRRLCRRPLYNAPCKDMLIDWLISTIVSLQFEAKFLGQLTRLDSVSFCNVLKLHQRDEHSKTQMNTTDVCMSFCIFHLFFLFFCVFFSVCLLGGV